MERVKETQGYSLRRIKQRVHSSRGIKCNGNPFLIHPRNLKWNVLSLWVRIMAKHGATPSRGEHRNRKRNRFTEDVNSPLHCHKTINPRDGNLPEYGQMNSCYCWGNRWSSSSLSASPWAFSQALIKKPCRRKYWPSCGFHTLNSAPGGPRSHLWLPAICFNAYIINWSGLVSQHSQDVHVWICRCLSDEGDEELVWT